MKSKSVFSSLNLAQKIVCFVTASAFIVGAVLHNPLSGYIIKERPAVAVEHGVNYVPCTSQEKEAMQTQYDADVEAGAYDHMTAEQAHVFIETMIYLCKKSVPYTKAAVGSVLPVGEWRTTGPTFQWFGRVINFIQFSMGLIAIAVMSVIVFPRNRDNDAVITPKSSRSQK